MTTHHSGCGHALLDWKRCVSASVCVREGFSDSAGGELWIHWADGLGFNWESARLCRRATGMCIVKLYFSFVLTKCWCKGRGSKKRIERERGREGARERKQELDCIIDYPITSTALRNYPSPRRPVTHPGRSRAADSCSAAHRGWRVALGGEKKDG